MKRQRFILAAAAALVLGACGGSSSSSERDRNIAGGGSISTTTAPYQVSLISWNVSNGQQTTGGGVCGGTIISPEWILTADHCIKLDAVTGVPVPGQIYIGSGNANFTGSFRSPETYRTATAVYRARDVSGDVPGLDLALLKVSRPFTFSASVQPAMLPVGLDASQWPAFSQKGFITGWGRTLQDTGQTSLNGVEVKVNNAFDSPYCQDDSNPYVAYFKSYGPTTHLCLIRPSTDVLAAACSGDSGGPFVVKMGDKNYVAGVASQATSPSNDPFNFCSGVTPSLYTRVTAGLDWIVPGNVNDLTARTTDGRVDLAWTQPTHAPASPIVDYRVDMRTAGSTDWATINDGKSDSTAASITDLTTGNTLEFRVAALNDINSADAGLLNFTNFTVTVGVPPTTSTTTSTTTTVVTTTTLPQVTTTIAPSTTARQISVGPKPTTTTAAPVIATTLAPTKTTVVTTTTSSSGGAGLQVVTAKDPKFENPTLPPDLGTLPKPEAVSSKSAAVTPQPVIGATWSATDVASTGKVSLPAGGLVSISVPAKSSKVCKSNGSGLTMVGKGTCKATVSVTVGSGKPKKKTVSIKVS